MESQPAVTQREAGARIHARAAFRAGSLYGMTIGTDYVVFSYAMEIGRWTPGHGWTLNDTKVSVTTSKHQSIVRRATW